MKPTLPLTTTTTTTKRRKVLALEGLRPLLVLWIVLHHYPGSWASPGSATAQQVLVTMTGHAQVGVEIFLVMSGFVVGLAGGPPRRKDALRWLVHRISRLAPTYYLVIFLAPSRKFDSHRQRWRKFWSSSESGRPWIVDPSPRPDPDTSYRCN